MTDHDHEPVRPLHVRRDPDRERASSNNETVTAVGAEYPSGDIIIQWRREAFAEGERARAPVTSHYRKR